MCRAAPMTPPLNRSGGHGVTVGQADARPAPPVDPTASRSRAVASRATTLRCSPREPAVPSRPALHRAAPPSSPRPTAAAALSPRCPAATGAAAPATRPRPVSRRAPPSCPLAAPVGHRPRGRPAGGRRRGARRRRHVGDEQGPRARSARPTATARRARTPSTAPAWSLGVQELGRRRCRAPAAPCRGSAPRAKSALQPGDLVFFYRPVSHVGIYIGDGKVVHASNRRAR